MEKKSKANLMHIYCCRQLIPEMHLPKLFMQACLTGLLSVSISHSRLARNGQEGQSAYWIFMVSNLLRLLYYLCSQQCLFWVSGCWLLLLQGKSLRVSKSYMPHLNMKVTTLHFDQSSVCDGDDRLSDSVLLD